MRQLRCTLFCRNLGSRTEYSLVCHRGQVHQKVWTCAPACHVSNRVQASCTRGSDVCNVYVATTGATTLSSDAGTCPGKNNLIDDCNQCCAGFDCKKIDIQHGLYECEESSNDGNNCFPSQASVQVRGICALAARCRGTCQLCCTTRWMAIAWRVQPMGVAAL